MNKREIDHALKQIAHGDNDAFGRLYTETKRGVYAFLFSYFKSSADCEDAMQTTYLKIKQNIGQYKAGSNGLAWILQIAKNTALNEIRKNSNYIGWQAESAVGEMDDYESLETRSALTSVMRRVLDEEEQRILILHVIWGYKHKEIATILQRPLGTITSKYKRAADKLKVAWKEEER